MITSDKAAVGLGSLEVFNVLDCEHTNHFDVYIPGIGRLVKQLEI